MGKVPKIFEEGFLTYNPMVPAKARPFGWENSEGGLAIWRGAHKKKAKRMAARRMMQHGFEAGREFVDDYINLDTGKLAPGGRPGTPTPQLEASTPMLTKSRGQRQAERRFARGMNKKKMKFRGVGQNPSLPRGYRPLAGDPRTAHQRWSNADARFSSVTDLFEFGIGSYLRRSRTRAKKFIRRLDIGGHRATALKKKATRRSRKVQAAHDRIDAIEKSHGKVKDEDFLPGIDRSTQRRYPSKEAKEAAFRETLDSGALADLGKHAPLAEAAERHVATHAGIKAKSRRTAKIYAGQAAAAGAGLLGAGYLAKRRKKAKAKREERFSSRAELMEFKQLKFPPAVPGRAKKNLELIKSHRAKTAELTKKHSTPTPGPFSKADPFPGDKAPGGQERLPTKLFTPRQTKKIAKTPRSPQVKRHQAQAREATNPLNKANSDSSYHPTQAGFKKPGEQLRYKRQQEMANMEASVDDIIEFAAMAPGIDPNLVQTLIQDASRIQQEGQTKMVISQQLFQQIQAALQNYNIQKQQVDGMTVDRIQQAGFEAGYASESDMIEFRGGMPKGLVANPDGSISHKGKRIVDSKGRGGRWMARGDGKKREYGAANIAKATLGGGIVGTGAGAELFRRGRTRESSYGDIKKYKKGSRGASRMKRFIDTHTATGTDRKAVAKAIEDQARWGKTGSTAKKGVHKGKIKSSMGTQTRASGRISGRKKRVLGYGALAGAALAGTAAAAYRAMKRRRKETGVNPQKVR